MLKFNENGKFCIMQVSDPQDLQLPRFAMLQMLAKAYDTIQPDLVLFTGDNILGNHLADAIIGDKKVVSSKTDILMRMQKALANVLDQVEARNLPFAMIYGNHDDMNCITKEEQYSIYRSYKNFIPVDGVVGLDCDTGNLPIYDVEGKKILWNLWLMDSAGHDDDGGNGYEYVKKEAVDWYKQKSAALRVQNGGQPVDSLWFQHIPLQETLQLLEPCASDTPGSVVGDDGNYYRLNPEKAHGLLGEYPCVCTESNGVWDAIKECGDVKAVVYGHDHTNNFTGRVDNIDMVQTACASFRCYGKVRGVRLFHLDANKPGVYQTEFVDYYDLMGKSPLSKFNYIMNADGEGAKRAAILAGVGVATLGCVLGAKAICKSLKK